CERECWSRSFAHLHILSTDLHVPARRLVGELDQLHDLAKLLGTEPAKVAVTALFSDDPNIDLRASRHVSRAKTHDLIWSIQVALFEVGQHAIDLDFEVGSRRQSSDILGRIEGWGQVGTIIQRPRNSFHANDVSYSELNEGYSDWFGVIPHFSDLTQGIHLLSEDGQATCVERVEAALTEALPPVRSPLVRRPLSSPSLPIPLPDEVRVEREDEPPAVDIGSEEVIGVLLGDLLDLIVLRVLMRFVILVTNHQLLIERVSDEVVHQVRALALELLVDGQAEARTVYRESSAPIETHHLLDDAPLIGRCNPPKLDAGQQPYRHPWVPALQLQRLFPEHQDLGRVARQTNVHTRPRHLPVLV